MLVSSDCLTGSRMRDEIETNASVRRDDAAEP
jgi:hypothetical protein